MAGDFYRRSPAVDETAVGERMVLYHRVSGAAIVLNPAASIIWNELSREREQAELARALSERFPSVDSATIDQDVSACLEDLARHQLVSAGRGAGETTA